jgi:hypothetical protein
MKKEPYFASFWRALGYRDDQLKIINWKFAKEQAVVGAKAFFFVPISMWFLMTGKPKKIATLFKEVITT